MSSCLVLLLVAFGGDLEAAQKALEAKQYNEAIELLGDLAQGEDGPANAVLGRAHLALREYEAAVEPLLTAADALPQDRQIAYDAAYACWGSAQVNPQFARAYLDDALRMARRSGKRGLIAQIKKSQGDYRGALEGFLELEDSIGVRQHIAECLDGLGREKEAKEAWGAVLEEAIRTDELRAAYDSAGKAGRGGQLINWLTGVLEKDPEKTWYRLYRGYARVRLMLYAEAAQDLRIAALERPDDLQARAWLSMALAEQGIAEQRDEVRAEAEQVASEVIAREAQNDRAWATMARLSWYAWANREVGRAHVLLKRMHAARPDDRDTALNFAAMARRLGHYAESQKVYRALLEQDPGDPAALNDLGILHDGMGDRPSAIAAWKRVLQEDPEELNALENLFTAAWERGDEETARSYLARGLAVARRQGGSLLDRWNWFSDRLGWVVAGHGG